MSGDDALSVLANSGADELVFVQDSDAKVVALKAQISSLNGSIVWDQADEKALDHFLSVAQHWRLAMLNDEFRNRVYHDAIAAALRQLTQKVPSPLVLDVGTGTGLLALIAASKGAGEVIACEMVKPLGSIARAVIAQNKDRFDASVTVISAKSTELSIGADPGLARKADMMVSEILDHTLLGEGMLPSVRHAWANLLQPHALVIPQRASVFVQCVQSDTLSLMDDVPFIRCEVPVQLCPASKKPIPIHISQVKDLQSLTDAVEVLKFDFSSPSALPPEAGRTVSIELSARASGHIDGVLMWWEAEIFDGIVYSTKANAQPWQDHWRQVFFPCSRLPVNNGSTVLLQAKHDELTISFEVSEHKVDSAKRRKPNEATACTCGLHNVFGPQRIAALMDPSRNQILRQGLQKVLSSVAAAQGSAMDALTCLDIADFSLLAMQAAHLGCKNVFTLEAKPQLASLVGRIGDLHRLGLQMIPASVEELCVAGKDVFPSGVDVLLFEPFLAQLEQLPLSLALSFWFSIQRIREAGLMAGSAVPAPFRCRVRAAAVCFESLQLGYRAVGDLLGLDHSPLRDMQADLGAHDFVFPLWQHPFTQLSESVTIATFEYSQPAVLPLSETPILVTGEAKCNAVVYWLEFSLDEQNEYVLSTDARVTGAMQTVRFFATEQAPRKLRARVALKPDSELALSFLIEE